MSKWYVVNVMVGQENNVFNEIVKLSEQNEKIKQAFIPTKKIMRNTKGKKVEAQQKLFPGYVFVNMDMDKDSYAVVRSTHKVLGFLGSKTKPEEIPDSKMEKLMDKINEENSLEENVYEIGDTVRVTEGPFESFTGTVESKDSEKNLLRISISIFGRPTIIDIEASRVEKA